MNGRRLYWRWVRATWIGWIFGIPSVVALALLGEAVGIGGAQVLVGAGMGLAIGLLQGRVMRDLLQRATPWVWSCVGGLSLPFLVSDVARVARVNLGYSLYAAVAVGGLTVGLWQAMLLRQRFRGTHWWVVTSAVGWTLAGVTAGATDLLMRASRVRGVPALVAYLGLLAIGGLLLGLMTGVPLVRLMRRERAGGVAAVDTQHVETV